MGQSENIPHDGVEHSEVGANRQERPGFRCRGEELQLQRGKNSHLIKKISKIERLKGPPWDKHFQEDIKGLFDENLDMFLSTRRGKFILS